MAVVALVEGLNGLGWIEGRNIHIERRFAGGRPDLIRDYARELVALSPDLIVAGSPPVVQALLHLTRTLPIVFATSTDPVGQGFVDSLARPGGNVTGFSSFEFSMSGKWVQLLKEIAPNIDHVGVVFNPESAAYMRSFVHFAETAAASSSVDIRVLPVKSTVEIESTIATLARECCSGRGRRAPSLSKIRT
jgi:putative ABC transport system substrate-binding protein